MNVIAFSPAPLSCKLTGGRVANTRRSKPILATTTSPLRQPTGDTHIPLPQEKLELFKSIEPWVSKNVLPLLKPVEKCWQPNDFLPDSTKDGFIDEVLALQNRVKELPDEYLVVLAGNMIVEDAIPTYQTLMNTLNGVNDKTGADPSPWAMWFWAWTAEENRHGDLLKAYLYLTGRVDMRMIEKTVQYLIGAGMNERFENNPYVGFVYVSFQERTTFVNHGNIARLVNERGDPLLATICGTIAADEKRHENAYIKIVEKLLEVDPNEAMLAIGKMMKHGVRMPGILMHDGQDPNLFLTLSSISKQLGVYSTKEYVNILEFLIERWRLERLEGLKGDGMRAQEFVCSLPNRIMKMLDRDEERAKKEDTHRLKFSWIFNKEVTI